MQLALGLAIKLARDHRTETDEEKYSPDFKGFIFTWAEEIDKIPQEAWIPPNAVKLSEDVMRVAIAHSGEGPASCPVCHRPLMKHSRQEIITCLNPTCEICQRPWGEHAPEETRACEKAEHAKNLAILADKPCPTCGKLFGEHSKEQLRECFGKRP